MRRTSRKGIKVLLHPQAGCDTPEYGVLQADEKDGGVSMERLTYRDKDGMAMMTVSMNLYMTNCKEKLYASFVDMF